MKGPLLEKKYTYCRICEASCGFVAEVENNKIVKYYADRDHPVSMGYSCVKGREMINIQNDPKLLQYPLKKFSNGFGRISWEKVVDEIGSKLLELKNKYGPNSIGMYFGNPTAFSYSAVMYSAAFMKIIGSRNLFSAGSQDCNNKFAHSKRFYGSNLIIIVPDFDNIDYFLALGTNPAASHFSFVVFPRPMQRLMEMQKRGCKIVWINPRKIEPAKSVGEHHFIYPNTDIFFLFGIINYILENNLEDINFIQKYSNGIEQLRKVASEFGADLDKVARLTCIDKEMIIKIAHDFVEASKKGGASVYGRAGTDRGSFATLLAWAKDVLNFITGNVDQKGNFYSVGVVNPVGLANKADAMRPEKSSGEKRKGSRIGHFPSVLGTYPAGIMADEILTPGDGQIKAMLVMAGDPLLSCPNAKRLESAFKELELLVSIDFYLNDTGIASNYILPATTFLEREDFMLTTSSFNPIPFAGTTNTMLVPGGERKPEWEIFNLILKRMGVPSLGGPPIELFKAMISRDDKKRFRELVKAERGIFLNEQKVVDRNTLLPIRIQTPDKLIDLVPEEYYEEFDKLRKWSGPDKSKFTLISGRQLETINSWVHLKGETNYCYINDKDALQLGIKNFDTVRVGSKIGSIEIQAQITADLLPGVVWIPHGWGRTVENVPDIARTKPGINVNLITDDHWESLETFAGMVLLDGIAVKVEKV